MKPHIKGASSRSWSLSLSPFAPIVTLDFQHLCFKKKECDWDKVRILKVQCCNKFWRPVPTSSRSKGEKCVWVKWEVGCRGSWYMFHWCFHTEARAHIQYQSGRNEHPTIQHICFCCSFQLKAMTIQADGKWFTFLPVWQLHCTSFSAAYWSGSAAMPFFRIFQEVETLVDCADAWLFGSRDKSGSNFLDTL